MMGKTYEALLRAGKLQKNEENIKFVEPYQRFSSNETISCQYIKSLNLEPYEHLKTSIIAKCQEGGLKTILFNGTKSGCGCSTTALGVATIFAKNPKLKVLLLEVNLRTPGLKRMLLLKNSSDLVDSVNGVYRNTLNNQKVEFDNLSIICCGANSISEPLGFFESSNFEKFIENARNTFDYVILDAPPVPIFSEFRILCSKVDGVVLVIPSEKIRRQVALKAKKEIEEAGGRILGVVLNKRKYYIPNWLYQRL